jgi:hypothetical protein
LQQQRKRAAATKAKGPRQKFISFQMFLFVAFASRRRPRGLQIRIKTNAKEAKVHFISNVLIFSLCLEAPFAFHFVLIFSQTRIKTNATEAKRSSNKNKNKCKRGKS